MMNTLKKISLLFSVTILLMSFSKINEEKIPTNEIYETYNDASPVDQDGWSDWKTTTCFRYLKYQIKKASNDNGEWYIRFKNNYNKNISMSIEVSGNVSGRTDDGRFTVGSGKNYTQYYFVSKSSSRINFTLKKVIFGKDNWSGPYAECDY